MELTKSFSSKKNAFTYKTIGEVAQELDLPQYVLRFWESKFKQIKPIKRRGGHRYYSVDVIAVIKEIRTLLYDKGYTIKGAQKFLADNERIIREAINLNSIASSASQHDLFASLDADTIDAIDSSAGHKQKIRDICVKLKHIQQEIQKEFSIVTQ